MQVHDVLERLKEVRRNGAGWTARCPAHNDRRSSLSVSTGVDGGTLIHCHASCDVGDIVAAIGLELRDLYPENGATVNGKPPIIATYEYHDADNALLFQVCRLHPKKFQQRRPDGNHGWVYNLKGVRRVLYRLPELRAADPKLRVFLLEGEKDANKLAAAGLIATTNPGGASKWKKAYNASLKGRHVVLLPDNDEAGRKHVERVAQELQGVAASVKVLALPGLPEKGDVSDWLAGGGTAAQLLELANAAPLWTPAESSSNQAQRVIDIGPDESRVIDEAVDALATCEGVYQRGGMLVHVVRNAPPPRGINRPPEAPRIVAMPAARLRELLASAALWRRPKGEAFERVHPPRFAVAGVEARGQWQGIRRIEAVSETPILRADGTILQEPGYDEATGILFEPRGMFPRAPESPTLADAQRARDALLDVVGDFPFKSEAHKAAWLAATLTPLARYAFAGPSPLMLVDANTRGSGKGLLVDVAAIISTGREVPRTTVPASDEECRKRITSIAIAGEPLVLLDNAAGAINLPSLDAALTTTTWSDRVLGRSEMTGELPLYAVWFLTANNIVLAADTARRSLHVRLESRREKPEERDDFRHPNLLQWVQRERPRLAIAAVTILRAYFVAGRPTQRLPSWGSYEGWSDRVRQAVVWCGMPDPGETRQELSDGNADIHRQLIAGWLELDPGGEGKTAAQALDAVRQYPEALAVLRNALLELPSRSGDFPTARSLGMKLHHLQGRIAANRYFMRRDSQAGRVWARGRVRD